MISKIRLALDLLNTGNINADDIVIIQYAFYSYSLIVIYLMSRSKTSRRAYSANGATPRHKSAIMAASGGDDKVREEALLLSGALPPVDCDVEVV